TLRKLSRGRRGVSGKPAPVETLCGIDFVCWVDSRAEPDGAAASLESRLRQALERPEEVRRSGVLCLGASDDAVDSIALWTGEGGPWHWLMPAPDGAIELPAWADHVGSDSTRCRRYRFEPRDFEGRTMPPPIFFVAMEPPGASQ